MKCSGTDFVHALDDRPPIRSHGDADGRPRRRDEARLRYAADLGWWPWDPGGPIRRYRLTPAQRELLNERAAAIQAILDLQSQPGAGTRLSVIWPAEEYGEEA